MALLNDLIPPTELLGFVRTLEFPDLSVLDDILPDTEVQNIEYAVMKDTRADVDAAEYRGFDTEAGIGKRPGTQRLRGKIPPVSRKIRLGEEEILRLEAEKTGDTEALIEAIFDDAASMTRAVRARVTLAKGSVLATGKVTLAENGVVAEADYGVPGGNITTVGTAWSNTAASMVTDLTTVQAAYRTTNKGLNPGGIIINSTILGYMLRNTEMRTLLASIAGAPALITRQGVDAALQAFGLPPILKVIDTQVMVNGSATYLIPQDKVIFVPPATAPLGATPFGITAEALRLRQGGQIEVDQLSGMIATVSETTFDSVATWTKASALAIPVLANPDRLAILDVIP